MAVRKRRADSAGASSWQANNDPVQRPEHYTFLPNGIECIDVAENFSFCAGNALKYIWRHRHKGEPIEDLEKAVFYLKREIARLSKEKE